MSYKDNHVKFTCTIKIKIEKNYNFNLLKEYLYLLFTFIFKINYLIYTKSCLNVFNKLNLAFKKN